MDTTVMYREPVAAAASSHPHSAGRLADPAEHQAEVQWQDGLSVGPGLD